MRIGVAGVGRIGSQHAETLAGFDVVEDLVLADADPVRARAVADKLAAVSVNRPEQLLCIGLDGLVIAAPTAAHAPLLTAAIDAGIPAFCEKPVAADIAGTLAIQRHVDSHNATVHIGFQRRFDPGYQAARAALADGSLGWLHSVRASTLDPAPPPADYVAGSGGIFRDCSVHDFDILRWVTGREVVEVYATGANRGADFFAAAGDVDTAAAVLSLDDGTLATVAASRYNGAGYDVRLELLGSAGSVAVGTGERSPLRSVEPSAPDSDAPAPTYRTFLDRFAAAYVAELTAFTTLVASGGPSPCSVADALESFWVAEACARSRRERRPVSLAEVRSTVDGE